MFYNYSNCLNTLSLNKGKKNLLSYIRKYLSKLFKKQFYSYNDIKYNKINSSMSTFSKPKQMKIVILSYMLSLSLC